MAYLEKITISGHRGPHFGAVCLLLFLHCLCHPYSVPVTYHPYSVPVTYHPYSVPVTPTVSLSPLQYPGHPYSVPITCHLYSVPITPTVSLSPVTPTVSLSPITPTVSLSPVTPTVSLSPITPTVSLTPLQCPCHLSPLQCPCHLSPLQCPCHLSPLQCPCTPLLLCSVTERHVFLKPFSFFFPTTTLTIAPKCRRAVGSEAVVCMCTACRTRSGLPGRWNSGSAPPPCVGLPGRWAQ